MALCGANLHCLCVSSRLPVSGADGSAGNSAGLICWPGTRYSSLVHLSKSISLHLSEQNGRHGLSCHGVIFPQVGHFGIRKSKKERDKSKAFGVRRQSAAATALWI